MSRRRLRPADPAERRGGRDPIHRSSMELTSGRVGEEQDAPRAQPYIHPPLSSTTE